MVYHWSLSESKSPRVHQTLLSFLVDLTNAVVWMVSTSRISKLLVPVPIGDCTERTNSSYHRHFIITIYSLEFFTSALADGFLWSLSDSKFPQVSRTPVSILAVHNNVVVWMVSTRLPTSKSSSPFGNPFVTVPNAPITIGIIVTCMFHSFFNSLAK